MHTSSRQTSSEHQEDQPNQRLESWKEIATYLKRGVRTIQRWEKEEELPIHRHVHDKLGTVYASRSELDAWWVRRPQLEEQRQGVAGGYKRWQLLLALSLATLVIAVGAIWWLSGKNRRLSTAGIQSMAVLPFENLSGDPQQDYFADGITEELITELGKIGTLRLISRTSIMQYKGARPSLPQIGKQLNVDAVVEGSVTRSGQKVRITAQLIQVKTDRHLWAESYERELGDLVALQDEVARAVADAVHKKLASSSQLSTTRLRPTPEVQDAYFKGRYYWNQRTGAGLDKSIEYFTLATDREPAYAPAYAGLADAYILLSVWGTLPSRESLPKAKAAALRAIQLDDGLAEAHTSLAVVKHRYDWDWNGAEEEFRRAIQLNPSYATAHQWYGEFLGDMQRPDEATKELKQAQEIDPLSPIIRCDLAMAFYNARNYDLAIQEVRKVLDTSPNFSPAHGYLASFYEAKGLFREAIAESQKAVILSGGPPGNTLLSVAHTYALSGNRVKAESLMNEFKRLRKGKEIPPFYMTLVYAGLGEKDEAFTWLEKA
jgi:TolB-like protein/Tfp pilus assembly protein PilF